MGRREGGRDEGRGQGRIGKCGRERKQRIGSTEGNRGEQGNVEGIGTSRE